MLLASTLLASLASACEQGESTIEKDASTTAADQGTPNDLGQSSPDGGDPFLGDVGSSATDSETADRPIGPDARFEEDAGTAPGMDAGTIGGLPSTTATHVAVGRVHACAVTAEGRIRCWGAADYGQLGNGVIDGTSSGLFSDPIEVNGIGSDATDVSSFANHTCAIVADGVRCWGANDEGQLGDGTFTISATPVLVSFPGGFVPVQVAVGEAFSCARSLAGAVSCWGKNDYGQLGNGDAPNGSASPVEVSGLGGGVRSIAAGTTHACAAMNGGEVRCWGSNLYGEQGNGTYGNGSAVPGVVQGLSGVSAIDVGAGENFSCLVSSDGASRCWGRNYDGQLGNGASGFDADELLPVPVQGLGSGTVSISGGYGFACAIASGAARCWGSNVNLVLGNGGGPSESSSVPVVVSGLSSGATAIAASATDHACAIANGAVFCWGSAGPFLGNGDPNSSAATPVSVTSLP